MSKKKEYITLIRKAVAACNDGEVPPYLEIRIRDAAKHREVRDMLWDKIEDEGLTIIEVGSMGQQTSKQNPLLPTAYQYDQICMNDDKLLGLTSAKAAMKTEAPADKKDDLITTLGAMNDAMNGR